MKILSDPKYELAEATRRALSQAPAATAEFGCNETIIDSLFPGLKWPDSARISAWRSLTTEGARKTQSR
jgi:hypothetical protein